jgi:hypothetical protein
MPELFSSPAEIEIGPDDRVICLRVGIMNTTVTVDRFYRTSKSRPCGMFLSVDLVYAHFVPVTLIFNGRFVSSTKRYVVDNGADETSFPGYLTKIIMSLFTITLKTWHRKIWLVLPLTMSQAKQAIRTCKYAGYSESSKFKSVIWNQLTYQVFVLTSLLRFNLVIN